MSVPPIDIDEYNMKIHNRLDIDKDVYHGNHHLTDIMNYTSTYVSQNYKANDVVFYNDVSYICILDTISSEIPIDSSLPFLKQLSLTKSPSSIVVFKVLPTLF